MSISISATKLSKSFAPMRLSAIGSRLFRNKAGVSLGAYALRDIDLSVQEGERVGVVGENGAGKSTLLRILAGVDWPTSGDLEVSGKVHAALTLGVGLREELSGRKNLLLDAEIQDVNLSADSALVEKMIEFADLGEFIDQPVRTYSSGMKSRLCFTSLVFVEPQILLIDEALSTGDQWFQKKASAAVRSLCDKGRIVFIVSHSLATIREMCTRCIWLSGGKIVADGDAKIVTEEYAAYLRHREEDRQLSFMSSLHDRWSRGGSQVMISELSIGDEHDSRQLDAVFVRDPFVVTIGFRVEEDVAAPSINMTIVRVDGACVVDDCAKALFPETLRPGDYKVRSTMERMLLAPGLYSVNVEIRSSDEPLVRQSISLRVKTDEEFTGGRPFLYQPILVEFEARSS